MRCMHRHIIVSGDDALATTIADELKNAGVTVVRMVDPGRIRGRRRS